MDKNILMFIIIILILGIMYLYGIVLDIKNPKNNIKNNNLDKKSLLINNNSNTIYSSPKLVKPTFQFSTDFDNKKIDTNLFRIDNVEVYDDLLIDDKKYYFDRELYITFDYILPENQYFYFSIVIDAIEETKHSIKFTDNITLIKGGRGNMNKNPLSFIIPSIENDDSELVISRIRILINNMKNEIVYNTIIPLDLLVEKEEKNNNIENKNDEKTDKVIEPFDNSFNLF